MLCECTDLSANTSSKAGDEWDAAMGSVGKALPNLAVRYVSPDGNTLPLGEEGEIWIKGPTVFKGYHNNPQATGSAITADGYFKTGDVGYEDKGGNLFVTDRLKELIKFKGFQVAPAELEGLLANHPKVLDVAVLGIYSEATASEVPMAYIVPAPGTARDGPTAKEIVEWHAARAASYKRLRGGIVWIDGIPKSASGKILRRLLKAKLGEEPVIFAAAPVRARL